MLLALAVLPVILAACERVATHESGPAYSSKVETAPTATYQHPASGGPAAYQGAGKAKADYAGSSDPAAQRAYGELDAGKFNYVGSYGAAFYFPVGTFTGPNPAQTGTVDIMRWSKGSDHGGLRLGNDGRVHLVKASGEDVEDEKQFTLREGCWNWLVVHQNLSTSNSANEVFLNGERIISSTKTNTSTPVALVDNVRFGLVEIGAAQTNPLSFYVDDAYVSSDSVPKPPAAGVELCKPLPNVLFMVTDDQRAESVEPLMPNVLKWFRDGQGNDIKGGTEFKHAFATTPLCCPSRASIFSGRYAHNHGVIRLNRAHPDATINPPRPGFNQDLTLQRYLSDAGYRNAMYGKFMFEFVTWNPDDNIGPGGNPCPCFDSTEPVKHFDDYGIFEAGYENVRVRERGSPSDVFSTLPTYTTTYVRSKGIDFIDSQAASEPGRPWFLYLATAAPHGAGERDGLNAWSTMTSGSSYGFPLFNPPAFTPPPNQFEADRSDKPRYLQHWADNRRIFEKMEGDARYPGLREQQLRTLKDVDDLVEDVFQTLQAGGEANNTLAFFASDNGYVWREHGPPVAPGSLPQECLGESGLGDGRLTGSPQPCGGSDKLQPYLESVRIPLMMRWPDSSAVQVGTNASSLVANVDMAPTVIDAIGETDRVSAIEPMDGRSLQGSGLDRSQLLLEGWRGPPGIPTWASLIERDASQGLASQYIGYYPDDAAGSAPSVWEEFYDGTDVLTQLDNRYTDGHSGGPGEPPAPDLTSLRSCKGPSECP